MDNSSTTSRSKKFFTTKELVFTALMSVLIAVGAWIGKRKTSRPSSSKPSKN